MTDKSSVDFDAEAEVQPLTATDDVKLDIDSPPASFWRKHSRWVDVQSPLVRKALYNLTLILIWYFFSTLLSVWNSILLGKQRGVFNMGAFPAPLLMTSIQFTTQVMLSRGVLRTGLVHKKAELVPWKQYFWQVIPNGLSTGLDIGFSNYSLARITLSFYTMCKSTTPIFLLGFCFLWGLERPSWSLAGVVGIMSIGLTLLVFGETSFDLQGFIEVMFASCLSGLRWTITQLQLQGNDSHGASGNPVEVLASLMPVMAVTVFVISLAIERLWIILPHSPYFASAHAMLVTAGVMSFGGVIAFLMVWTEFTVIQQTSALTFMVAGTFKELVTVLAAVTFLGETFSRVNAVGLCVLILGVVLFNYSKYKKVARLAPSERVSSKSPSHSLSLGEMKRSASSSGGSPMGVSNSSLPAETPGRMGLTSAFKSGLVSHREQREDGMTPKKASDPAHHV